MFLISWKSESGCPQTTSSTKVSVGKTVNKSRVEVFSFSLRTTLRALWRRRSFRALTCILGGPLSLSVHIRHSDASPHASQFVIGSHFPALYANKQKNHWDTKKQEQSKVSDGEKRRVYYILTPVFICIWIKRNFNQKKLFCNTTVHLFCAQQHTLR